MKTKDKVKKNDFIEIEFSAKIKDGKIFDTNIKSEAEKAGLNIKELKPFILSVGHGMLIKGLDEELKGKEVKKKYSSEFTPEKAFGKRDTSLIRMVPMKAFTEQKIMPQRGMQLSLDNRLAKILSVSGGRVLVDFNNPLAGRIVIYDFKINRKIDDIKEKINALQDFFFRKRFEFNIKDKNKTLLFKVPEPLLKLVNIFAKPFDEILGMKLKTEIIKEKEKKEKKEKKSEEKRQEKQKKKQEKKSTLDKSEKDIIKEDKKK